MATSSEKASAVWPLIVIQLGPFDVCQLHGLLIFEQLPELALVAIMHYLHNACNSGFVRSTSKVYNKVLSVMVTTHQSVTHLEPDDH